MWADTARVNAVSIVGCILVLWERLAARGGSRMASSFAHFSPSKRLALAALAILPALFLAQVEVLARQVANVDLHSSAAAFAALPIPVYDGDHGRAAFDPLFSALGFGLGAFETLAVAIVVQAIRSGIEIDRRAYASVGVALALVALWAPVMSTTDPYEYVATGLLGFGAYAPAHGSLAGTIYGPVERVVPIRGVIYGPLWVLVDTVQTSFGTTIAHKIVALRLTNVALVLAFLQALRVCRVSRAALVAVAINPFVWSYSVANPHADISGLLLLGIASSFARRSKVALAVLFVVAAGSIKIPFAVIGGIALVPLSGAVRRVALWCVAIALAVAVSYIARGHGYAHDVAKFAVAKSESNWAAGWVLMVPVVVVALSTMLAVRKGAGGIALLFDQAGPIAAPWYFYWGLPYALACGAGEPYLIALPFLGALRDETFGLSIVAKMLTLVVLSAFLVDRLPARRRASPAAATTSCSYAAPISKYLRLSSRR